MQGIVPISVLFRNSDSHYTAWPNFSQASRKAQWLVPNTFHNIMVFMICTKVMWIYTMGVWILDHDVDFEPWLGQVNPRTCIHKGTKKRQQNAI